MKEYIERTAALDICQKEYEERLRMADYCGDTVAWNIGGAIKSIPAADVAEVRHGRWEFLGPNRLIKSCMCGTCSVCHVRSKFISNIAICPTCGAHMDGEIKNETN